jgi:hypothetical protein
MSRRLLLYIAIIALLYVSMRPRESWNNLKEAWQQRNWLLTAIALLIGLYLLYGIYTLFVTGAPSF